MSVHVHRMCILMCSTKQGSQGEARCQLTGVCVHQPTALLPSIGLGLGRCAVCVFVCVCQLTALLPSIGLGLGRRAMGVIGVCNGLLLSDVTRTRQLTNRKHFILHVMTVF